MPAETDLDAKPPIQDAGAAHPGSSGACQPDSADGRFSPVGELCSSILASLHAHVALPVAVQDTIAQAVSGILSTFAETEAEVFAAQQKIQLLKRDLADTKTKFNALKRKYFGESSEREGSGEAEESLDLAPSDADETDTPYDGPRGRRKRQASADIPIEVKHHYPANRTCCGCGCEMPSIGSETSEQLVLVPERLVRVRHVYHRCACNRPVCKDNKPVAARSRNYIMRGRSVSLSLVVEAAAQKFAEHSTSYRMARRLAQSSTNVSRQTVGRNIMHLADHLRPVASALREVLCKAEIAQMDETPIRVQNPNNGRSGQADRGYFWVTCNDERNWNPEARPIVHFHYAPTRSGSVARGLIAGSAIRYLQTDGYTGYNALFDDCAGNDRLVSVRCMAHARRKFRDLPDTGRKDLRFRVLDRLKKIYAVEAEIRGEPAPVREAVRQARSLPVLLAMRSDLQDCVEVAQGVTANAIRYMLNGFEALTRFVFDGRLEIDSNGIERCIRPVALTKKNALFAGSHEAASVWAVYYTLFETARLNGVNPRAYLNWVVERIESDREAVDYSTLFPWLCPVGRITA